MEQQLSYSPAEALQCLAGSGVGNAGKNHVGRDVATLRRLGLRPQKVCGRWVVPYGELARWARGEAAPTPAIPAKRSRGRPRKNERLDVQFAGGHRGEL